MINRRAKKVFVKNLFLFFVQLFTNGVDFLLLFRDSRLFDQLLSNVSSKGFDLFFAMEKSITCIEFDF